MGLGGLCCAHVVGGLERPQDLRQSVNALLDSVENLSSDTFRRHGEGL